MIVILIMLKYFKQEICYCGMSFEYKLKIMLIMKFRIFFSLVAVSLIGLLLSFVPSENLKPGKLDEPGKKRTAKEENTFYIIVDKSDYELKVYDEEGWYATYPIVFGSKDLSDKMREGDKRTPNGKFKVLLNGLIKELPTFKD